MQNTAVLSLEGNLIDRNSIARDIDSGFSAVSNGIQTAMCSDCCGSNGNKCDPRDETYAPQ